MGLGLLLAANGAFAQSATNSAVEVYGVIDIAVGHVENSLSVDGNFPNTVSPVSATKTSVNNSVTGMINGGIQGSRWGVRGSEDLGGGLKHLVIHNYLVLIPQRLYSCGGIHNALQTDPYCFDAGFAVTLAS